MKANFETLETDILVVGTEATGAKAAVEAAKSGLRVMGVTKNIAGKSGVTIQAVATYQAAIGPGDSPELHFIDTVKGGKFLSNQKIAEALASDAPEVIHELEALGCKFARKPNKPDQYDLLDFPGYSRPRGAYTYPAGTTGRYLTGTMLKAIKQQPTISLLHDTIVSDILTGDGRVAGALAFNLRSGKPQIIKAKAVILATGGAMQIYSHSAAAVEATGDGFSMAYHLGLPLMDMEFVQYYPTCLVWPKNLWAHQAMTILRQNFSARLINAIGERFMDKYDPKHMEKGTRDIVARGSYIEIREGRGTKHGGVYLDISHLPRNVIDDYIAEHHPGFNFGGVKLLEEGIDIREQAVEVAPMAHFYLGGVKIDEYGRTELPGLFAGGEAAGGCHGANRLGGNALPEMHVFGRRAGRAAAEFARSLGDRDSQPDLTAAERRVARIEAMADRGDGIHPLELKKKLQSMMFDQSMVKHGELLAAALKEVQQLREQVYPRLAIPSPVGGFNVGLRDAIEVGFLLDVSEMNLKASIMRTETRGSHFREDYPAMDNENWLQNIIVQQRGGEMTFTRVPVSFDKVSWEGNL